MSATRAFSYFMRGVTSVILALLLSKLAYLNLVWISTPFDSVFRQLPLWAIKLLCAVAFLLVYNSLVHFLTLYDRRERESFLAEKRSVTFPSELLRIMRSPMFILETAGAVLFVIILCLFGAVGEIVGVFFIDTEPTRAVELLLPTLIYAPSFFLISLFCRYEIRRYFVRLAITDNLAVLDSRVKMALRLGTIILLYPTVFPYAPLLIYVALSFVNIFMSLSALLTAVGLILAVLALILLAVFIAYAKAIRGRLKFIKKMTALCAERGFTVEGMTSPVKSFFRHEVGVSFTLRRGEEVFDCRFLSTVWRGAPLCFTSERHAYILHRLGTKNHHISINHNIEWGFSSEGTKIILVSPMPRRVLAIAANGATRVLTQGDKIWDAVLYDTEAMLGALDRDCLGRTN